MIYKIVWDNQSRDFLRKLDNKEAHRIIKKINSIVSNPKHYLETLIDSKAFKLRIGKYRALIDVDFENKILKILVLDKRGRI